MSRSLRTEEPSTRLRDLRLNSLNDIVDVQPLARINTFGRTADEERSAAVIDQIKERQRQAQQARSGAVPLAAGGSPPSEPPRGGNSFTQMADESRSPRPSSSTPQKASGVASGVASADKLPSFLSKHKGKLLLGGATTAAAVLAARMAARKDTRPSRKESSKTAASLGDITGFNESREGWRELTRTGGPERVSGLPGNVSAEELEERLKDSYAIKKLSNPAMSATTAGLAGAALGAAQYRRPAGALLALPSAAGAALGSAAADYLVADKVTIPMLQKMIKEKRATEKKASLAEYSNLFDAVEQGKFGPHVKEALVGVCEGMSYSLQSSHATKVAAAPTEADARQARINQLLRKM